MRTSLPNLQLAPVPARDVLLLALRTTAPGGDGDVIAHGCVRAAAAPPSLQISQLDLGA